MPCTSPSRKASLCSRFISQDRLAYSRDVALEEPGHKPNRGKTAIVYSFVPGLDHMPWRKAFRSVPRPRPVKAFRFPWAQRLPLRVERCREIGNLPTASDVQPRPSSNDPILTPRRETVRAAANRGSRAPAKSPASVGRSPGYKIVNRGCLSRRACTWHHKHLLIQPKT